MVAITHTHRTHKLIVPLTTAAFVYVQSCQSDNPIKGEYFAELLKTKVFPRLGEGNNVRAQSSAVQCCPRTIVVVMPVKAFHRLIISV